MGTRRTAGRATRGRVNGMRKFGVAPRDLRDEDLEREMRHMWRTREETVLRGGSHAIRAHTDRMLELEHEYIARFPRETQPLPARTRRGSRAGGAAGTGDAEEKGAGAKGRVGVARRKSA